MNSILVRIPNRFSVAQLKPILGVTGISNQNTLKPA